MNLVWSTKPPTEPGNYCARQVGLPADWWATDVRCVATCLMVFSDELSDWVDVAELDWEWAGPIPQPAEPTGAEGVGE